MLRSLETAAILGRSPHAPQLAIALNQEDRGRGAPSSYIWRAVMLEVILRAY